MADGAQLPPGTPVPPDAFAREAVATAPVGTLCFIAKTHQGNVALIKNVKLDKRQVVSLIQPEQANSPLNSPAMQSASTLLQSLRMTVSAKPPGLEATESK